MVIKKRRLPTILTVGNIDEIIQGSNGALVYWGIQNQPPELWTPAWNRAKAGVAASSTFLGAELLTNGNFTDWTADDPDGWTVTEAGDATSNITENPADTCQLISDGTLTQVFQTVLTIGVRYRAEINITDITLLGNGLNVGDGGAGSIAVTTLGTTIFEFVATSTGFVIKRQGAACNISFDFASCRDTNPLNEDVTSLTLGQPGQGNIQYLALTDGVNDLLSLSAPGITALDAIFSADPFTLSGVCRVSASGIWTDTNVRTFMNLGVDANNFIKLGSDGAGNFQAQINSGGSGTRTLNTPMTTDELFTYAFTRTGNNLELFIDKVSVDTDATGLNAWAGVLLQNLCTWFAGTLAGSEFWSGSGAYGQIADQVQSQGDINAFHDSLGI